MPQGGLDMRKTISLFAVLMISLLIVGVTYAMWSKTLYLTGIVNTDSVSGVFTQVTNLDPPAPPGGPPSYDPIDPNDPLYTIIGPRELKDVGSTNVTGIGTDTLTVYVNNSYPSYYNDLEIHYENNGSVPVIIQNITLTTIGGWKIASTWNGTDGPVWVAAYDGIGSQLDPGQVKTQSLELHVTQAAAQNTNYMFQVTYILVQWNEYVP
jgi:hypothetical protein